MGGAAREPSDGCPALDGAALLTLQLRARDYTLRRIAEWRRVGVPDVVADLRRAADALGVDTVPAAIAEAKRRGLVV